MGGRTNRGPGVPTLDIGIPTYLGIPLSNIGIPMWVFQVQPRNSEARELTSY